MTPFLSQVTLAAILLLPLNILALRTTRVVGFAMVALGHVKAITSVPYHNPANAYAAAFLSAWYVIWAAGLLLAYNPKNFRRIQKLEVSVDSASGAPEIVCTWEVFPPNLGWKRIGWLADLLINFRGIGMEYQTSEKLSKEKSGDRDVKRPPRISYFRKGKARFLAEQGSEFVVAYLIVDFFQEVLLDRILPYCELHRTPDCIDSITGIDKLLSSRTIRYSVLIVTNRAAFTCLHAVVALFSVGVFTERLLGPAGEDWTHPAIFGSAMSLWTSGIRGYWGVFWHDYFKEGFHTCASLLLGKSNSSPSKNKLFHDSLVFILSGYIHAAGTWAVHGSLAMACRPFLFFCLQPLGRQLQSILLDQGSLLVRKGYLTNSAMHFVLALSSAAWLHWVFPLLIDDTVWGGIVERMRVPYSIIAVVREKSSF